MSQLHFIEELERRIGFVHHRLNCDSNYYAACVRPIALDTAMMHFRIACALFRESISKETIFSKDGSIDRKELPSPILDAMNQVNNSMNGFDVGDYD